MDIATVIGIVLGTVAVVGSIMAGGPLSAFIDVGSIFIVVGGTIASTLISFSLKQVTAVIGVVKKTFLYPLAPPGDTIKQLVHFADMARREGILFLEKEMANVEDEFLKQGLQLSIDGTEPDAIRNILTTEITSLKARHDLGSSILTSMGTMAPAFGMIGTLIGLVLMLGSMEDPSTIGPSMAVALLTTFYGAVLANIFFNPMAAKLQMRSGEEILVRTLMMEGILAMQSGDNPRIVEQKLISFIAPQLRSDVRKEE
ncbi:MAG: MotA/TolQ/ExbB proton channel family protein [Deferribacteres bacterium]|nr:MotA/TolQ/ExbB proton channel family protein [candidate division KSB1 bacterium]MCB9501932.1 MotA/TolQ/ExbB proton channel family protein [Deferribacteres bacterium]